MTRPVRPVALVILTACMVYPGVTMVWQGLHPFVTGAQFNLLGLEGPWMDMATKIGLPVIAVLGAKAAVGTALLLGVLGLWAGDGRAYPLALLGAVGALLNPVGPSVMGALALICLLGFREKAEEIPA